jgi:hypothetical protein
VARMSAVEEMAGMDILCSDKTGTLTLNELTVDKPNVLCTVPGMPVDEVRAPCGGCHTRCCLRTAIGRTPQAPGSACGHISTQPTVV